MYNVQDYSVLYNETIKYAINGGYDKPRLY
jgi:hypothetical protein